MRPPGDAGLDGRPSAGAQQLSGRVSTAGTAMTPAPDVSRTPNPADDDGVPVRADAPVSAGDVADRIEIVARADQALADELDWIGGCRAPVCSETVARLDALLGRLRDGADVRGELTSLDPAVLRAGAALWVRRRASAAGPPAAGAATAVAHLRGAG